MGTCSAVMLANIYVAYNEDTLILHKYNDYLLFFKQFIDDIIMIWKNIIGGLTVQNLKTDLQQGSLRWTTTPPDTSLVFLDVTVSINVEKGIISTKSYEKSQNLYTYITPNSAHTPGVLKGLIYGFVCRYWLQNSNINDYTTMIERFVKRLLQQGHQLRTIKTFVTEAAFHFKKPCIVEKSSSAQHPIRPHNPIMIEPSSTMLNTTHAAFHDRTFTKSSKLP